MLMTVEVQSLFKEHARLKRGKNGIRCKRGWNEIWTAKTDAQQTMIIAVLNFYEFVAGEYNDGGQLLDKSVADKFLSYVVDGVWLQAKPFVYWLREEYGDGAYEEWERMYRRTEARQGG